MCQARRRVRSITALSQELVVRGMGRPMVYRAAPLGTPTPGQALASYPGSVSTIARLAEVGTIPMIFTTAEFGADAKLDVAALGLATKHN